MSIQHTDSCVFQAHHLNQKSNDELVNKICDTMEIIALAMNDPNVRSAPQLVNDLNRVKVYVILSQLGDTFTEFTPPRALLV